MDCNKIERRKEWRIEMGQKRERERGMEWLRAKGYYTVVPFVNFVFR